MSSRRLERFGVPVSFNKQQGIDRCHRKTSKGHSKGKDAVGSLINQLGYFSNKVV